MDLEKLTKEAILKNMTPEQQKAVLDSVMASVKESKQLRSQKVAENIDLVMQALQKMEGKMLARVDKAASQVEEVAANVKDGRDGKDGKDGKAGKDGAVGPKGADGRNGKDGKDGKDGRDGVDGVSVVNAFLDFDNSLVIELSNGKQINVGAVLADATAEKVKVVANGGGTSQGVLDALAALQTEIDNLIPSQTGNSGKYLTTNGSVLSWASIGGGAGLSYQGSWNASTNSPTLASGTGTNGHYYIVSVAGTTNLDGVTDWAVGDWAIYNGSAWQKIDNSDLVTSVNGLTGAVTLTTSNVTEGTNLYYTDVRSRGSVSAGTGLSYNSTTGVFTNSSPDQTVSLTAGTGISTSGTYPSFTITNSAPDQTVSLTGGGTTSISGTYPNFTITSNDQYTGTVTSVTGTGVISSTGGTTPAISISQATTSTSGYLSSTDWNTFNGKATLPSQTGNSGKFLTTDGSSTSWGTLPSVLSVLTRSSTSVSIAVGNGLLPVLNHAGSTINVPVS